MKFKVTREWIDSLKIGSLAPDSFIDKVRALRPISRISFKGTSIHGKRYVGYYVPFGVNGWMSHSLLEGDVLELAYPPRYIINREFESVMRVFGEA